MRTASRYLLCLALFIALVPLWHSHLLPDADDPHHEDHCVLTLLAKCGPAAAAVVVVAFFLVSALATETALPVPALASFFAQDSPRAPPIA